MRPPWAELAFALHIIALFLLIAGFHWNAWVPAPTGPSKRSPVRPSMPPTLPSELHNAASEWSQLDALAAMAQSVERRLLVWKVWNLSPSRVKGMSYKIDACRYLGWCSALIGSDKDWLVQYEYQDKVTEWDIGS